MSTNLSIYDTFQPFYFVARALGLIWPSLKPARNSPLAIAVAALWLAAIITLQGYIGYNEWNAAFWEHYVQLTSSRLATNVLRLQLNAAILIGMSLVLFNSLSRNRIWILMENIAEVDQVLAVDCHVILPYKRERRNNSLQTIVIIICMLPVHVGSYFLLCALNTCYNRQNLVSNLIAANVTFILVAWFFAIYNCVRTRFRFLNLIFAQMLLLNDPVEGLFLKPLITGDTFLDELLANIIKLSRLHQQLCDCLKKVNQIFTLQLLVIISMYFALGTFGLFFFIRSLNTDAEGLLLLLGYTPLVWTVLLVVLVLLTLSVTTAVVREAKQTGIIVNRMIRRTMNDTLADQLLCVAEMVNASDIRVTCGLFDFDWQLVLSIVGTMTTYLLYLLQVDLT